MSSEEELVWSREWSSRMPGSGCQLVHCYGDAVMLLDHDIPRRRKVLFEAGEKPAGKAGADLAGKPDGQFCARPVSS